MMTSRPSVCAVIVTYHPDDAVGARVAAIAAQCDHVVIVDNGSESSELASLPGDVDLLRLGENRGIAAALNVGLGRALERGFAWAVTFDQDSTPAPGMLEALWTTRSSQPDPMRVAMVGPRLTEERVEHEDHRWVLPHPWCRLFFRRAPCAQADLAGVAFVITSGALMDLEAFRALGPMDEGLFIDYVDHDYCLRARRTGYDIVVSHRALLRHNLGSKREFNIAGRPVRPTFHSALRLRYMARNRVHLWRRFAWDFPYWATFDAVYGVHNVLRVVIFESGRWAKVLAAFRGTWDGLRGRFGRIPA